MSEVEFSLKHETFEPADDIRTERSWVSALLPYQKPDPTRSVLEIVVTVLPFIALWAGAATAVIHGHLWGLLLTIPAAGFLVRLFVIQHDCGHGNLFDRASVNDWIGRLIGVFTLTPYDYWRRTHSVHHATSGNLDRRGLGDVHTLTVQEYRRQSWLGRVGYRLYRHPIVLFGLGPAWLFIIQYRLPLGLMRAGFRPWLSTIGTNLAIVFPVAGMIWLIGLGPFLMVQIPITLMAATAGVWLFYVQHQFEDTHWSQSGEWSFQHAALYGSSHYDLPGPLHWITGNIGIHHVHHLAARIPFYRLPRVLEDHPDLRDMGRITLMESLQCVRLVLWDENAGRLVSFDEAAAS